MLERTARCLETGNLRRIIPGSKKLTKSRRMLHSAFWDHGATDLELSPLWSALVFQPDTLQEQDEGRTKAVGGAGGPFLDFLYPSGAMRIIRQFSSWSITTQDNRRSRAGFARFGQRLYTSISDANRIASADNSQAITLNDHPMMPSLDSAYATDMSELAIPDVLLGELLSGHRENEYDEAWRLYVMTDGTSRQIRKLPSRLFIYLSGSERNVDKIRSKTLLQQLRTFPGSENIYVSLIQQLLILKRQANALEVYDHLLETSSVPFGTDILLADLLTNKKWTLAHEVWGKFLNFRNSHDGKRREHKMENPDSPSPSLNYDPWKTLVNLSKLPQVAIDLAKFAITSADGTSRDYAQGIPLFAGTVVDKTLNTLARSVIVDKGKFSEILRLFHALHADSPPRYERLFRALLASGHRQLAVRCYRSFRQTSTIKISRPILREVTKVFHRDLSVMGMKQVLDDWIRYYGRPEPDVYRSIMPTFASIGDAATVKALFSQYVSSMRTSGLPIWSADDFCPLLHVHALRGELDKVSDLFHEMVKNFGVAPTLKSWNVVINACGRVKDVDGAQEAFEDLVSSGLQPDSYTYGTLMGICTSRGDREKVMELYNAAMMSGVTRTSPMVNCVVLAYIQDDRLTEAEGICQAALTMDLEGPRTRMWNYLVNAYGLRRDLKGVQRILGLMKDADIEWDGATYSALMQALAMKGQTDQAYTILKRIMPAAGIVARDYHFAVVMGGFVGQSQPHKVLEVYRHVLSHTNQMTSSVRLMALKAAAIEDQRVLKTGSEEVFLPTAEEYLFTAITNMDRQEVTGSLRKGAGNKPVDILAQSSYFSFLIFVYGQNGGFNRMAQLYEQYLESIPKERRLEPTIEIMSALMTGNLNKGDFESVQHLWDLAFKTAKKQGQRPRRDLGLKAKQRKTKTPPELEPTVLKLHRWVLGRALNVQMGSLARQGKFEALNETVEVVEQAGFCLDKTNWNQYVGFLVQNESYLRAFEICETKLMPRWTGWARLRWQAPIRNRLSIELRALRARPEHARPFHKTLLYLAKGYMDIRDSATESPNAQSLLDTLRRDCPGTVRALETMVRENSPIERAVLGGEEW